MRMLLNPFDEANKLSLKGGKWVVGVIETRVFWPKKKQCISYDGKTFLLLPFQQGDPLQTTTLPAIAIKTDIYKLSKEDGRKEILRFASALSWRERQKIEVIEWVGGNLPRSMGMSRAQPLTEYLDDEHLPAPANEAARTALALYREGVSLDNPFYSFLSFYKAFSVAVPQGRQRDKWMAAKRKMLGPEAAKRLAEIEIDGIQVGTYLYEQCRHAVAHADREPSVNPDNMDDHFRLTKDIPLMRQFAEMAIEETFAVKQLSTIHREHLFELEGFREVLPPELLSRLKQGEELQEMIELNFPAPPLIIARRGLEQHPLENMKFIRGHWIKNGVSLDFHSDNDVVRLQIKLNFAEEKLHFDPFDGLLIARDTNKKHAREQLMAFHFLRCILLNGHLEIWDINQQKRWGCSEGYIPVNCFVNTKFFDDQIAVLTEILSRNSSATKDCPAP